jgi:malonyl-CoA decarboxylase
VARFHLGNGARLERINWLGNTTPRGIEESYGIMVNYLYDPETIEANHEAFAHDGTVVRSAEVDALLVAAAPSFRIGAPVRRKPSLKTVMRQDSWPRSGTRFSALVRSGETAAFE